MEPRLQSQSGLAPGTLVAVVGPSGAGKDTLMSHAAKHFHGRHDVHFVQRVITRPEEAGGEAHKGVTEEEFEQLRRAGLFAVDWRAHGLLYGIPSAVREKLALGHLVVANGSRSALPSFGKAFSRLLVVNVIARPEILAARLEARGRESRDDILRRLARGSLEVEGPYRVVTVDNSDSLDQGVAAMNRTLMDVLDQRENVD